MCEHLNIFGLELPMYGMMILLGIIVSNAVALSLCKKFGRDKLELLTIESYGIIGAFLGSKILFLESTLFVCFTFKTLQTLVPNCLMLSYPNNR